MIESYRFDDVEDGLRTHRAVGWRWGAAFLVVCGVVGWASVGAAQEGDGPGASEPCEVGLVALDESARSRSVTSSVAELVGRTECSLVSGDALVERLASKQTREPADPIASEFSGLGSTVADGVEKFFYKGTDAAIDKLTPAFELGVNHLEVVSRRPDYADQIYEAGVVLVRGYLKKDRQDEAAQIADRLVALFPSRTPSTEKVPPDVVKYIEKRREAAFEEGAELKVLKLDRPNCKAFINGIPADEKAYSVVAGETYHVTMDCGSSIGPVWKAQPEAGQTLEVPVTDRSPLDHRMEDADFESRKRAESVMTVLGHWAGLPQVIGVSADALGDDSFLVGRQQTGGDATWSDGTKTKDIGDVLSEVWPEQAEKAGGVWDAPPGANPGNGRKIAGWSLIGSGAALSGGMLVYLLAEVNPARKKLLCSPNTDQYDPEDPWCSGVDPEEDLDNKSDVEAYSREVNTARALTFTGIGLGAAAVTTGVVLLATQPKSGDRAKLFIGPGPARAGASINIQF